MRKLKLGPAPAPETAGERGMIISVTEAIHLPSHRGMLQYHQPHHHNPSPFDLDHCSLQFTASLDEALNAKVIILNFSQAHLKNLIT